KAARSTPTGRRSPRSTSMENSSEEATSSARCMRGESLRASFVAEKPSETLVDDPRGLMETKEALAGASAIGVDLESNAMHVFRARLCFVQLSVPGRILVLDTLAEGVDAKILSETFLDPGVRKIFHDAQGDL